MNRQRLVTLAMAGLTAERDRIDAELMDLRADRDTAGLDMTILGKPVGRRRSVKRKRQSTWTPERRAALSKSQKARWAKVRKARG